MKILAIREATVPIGAAMSNAAIAFDSMTASALAIVTDRTQDGKPVTGYAFDSIGRYGKGALLRERFIPRLLAASPDSLLDDSGLIAPEACWRAAMANEKDGGHGERPGAIGLLDAALWDARAKLERKPLWRCLADHYPDCATGASPAISLYGSCGHYRPGRTSDVLDSLAAEVKRAGDAGYPLVKIKLGGNNIADDAARVEAASRALGGRIAVDANGRLDASIADAWLDRRAQLDVAWVEEPASALDYAALGRYASQAWLPIATGENLFSFDDARNLLRYGGLQKERDRVQVDVLLAYGVPEYVRILREYRAAGWAHSAFVPHAGHLFAAHLVAAFGLGMHEAAPDASLPYGGLWDGTAVSDGRTSIPAHEGAGYETKKNLYAILQPLSAPH